MVKIAYLDAFAGAAGDMWVGALLDLGLPLAPLEQAAASLGLPGVTLHAQRVQRAGLAGTHFVVSSAEKNPPHRHLPEILDRIANAGLPDTVRDRAQQVFQALGEAEARVHGTSIEKVHFHEVGAADTIVDIVCAVLGMHELGIEKVYCSAVVTGRGTVHCDHGEMPVPPPGSLASLTGIPLVSGGPNAECLTPTGAALLRVLVDEFEPQGVVWTPEQVGYGAGSRDHEGHPNLLRITLGSDRDPGSALQLVELSCQLDNVTGEHMAYLLEKAIEGGATDAYATPILMKKGRPGHLLTVLCEPVASERVSSFLLQESGSLGLRKNLVSRAVLERWEESVDTDLGPVRCKAARLPTGLVVRRPEDDEVRRLVQEKALDRATLLARLLPQL